MKRFPVVLVMLIACVFIGFKTMGTTGPNDPPSKYEKILQIVGSYMTEGHFSPKPINDEFSRKVYFKYFEELDSEKNLFLKKDIAGLQKYATRLDDEIKGAPVRFFREAGNIFSRRVEEASLIYKDILAKPFDFTAKEMIITDARRLDFPRTEAERQEAWRKRLKYMTLQRYVDLLDARESNRGKEGFEVKTDAELEKEARVKVMTAMDRTFDRYRKKMTEEEKFNIYVNTVTSIMDPYTEFFPPVDKRYFDEQLSGSFFGIGAQLSYDEGNIKVTSILPGGPAQKSEQLEVGDIIVKVAQGQDAAPVELTGFDVTDAVKLIRGKKGTEVVLTIRKKDGSLQTLSLIRDRIVQDETYVRSAVINEGSAKIGYIYLPEFYADFERPDGRRSSVDFANEVMKLKKENVEGIVIDLRNNGGGSLYDVIQIAGLFIDQGPIVQVKDRSGTPQVMRDKDGGVLFDGPLTVMVNEFSASASEILAAALQDYGRAIVIGSTSTFGKGTVQRNIGLDPAAGVNSGNSDLGSLKLTLQKFYRINGGSTQLKGVVPDIILPDFYEYLKLRERDNPNSLEWDEISKAPYRPWQPGYDLNTVISMSRARVMSDSIFQQIKMKTDLLASLDDKEYPLNLEDFRKEQKAMREAVKEIEKLVKLEREFQIAYLKQDENRYVSADKDKNERYRQWLQNIGKDIYVAEAVRVINEMVSQHNLARKKLEPARTF